MKRAALLFAVVLSAHAGLTAATKPRKPVLSPWKFSLDAEGGARFDDNILGLSAKDRERVDPSDPNNDDRFAIDSPEDFVLVPELGIRWSRSPAERRETRIGLRFRAHDYLRNSVKDYQEYQISFRQELNESRTHRSVLSIGGSRVPEYFVRRLTDDDESQVAGFTVRNNASFEKTEGHVEFSQEIVDRLLSAAVSYARERRNYNHHFDERDSNSNVTSLELLIYPGRSTAFRLRPYFEHEERTARGQVIGTAVADDDVGYDSDRFGLELRTQWGADADHRSVLRCYFEDETHEFSASSPSDTGHFGRQDDITRYGAGYERGLGPAWKLGISAYHRTNEVSSPASSTTTFRKNVIAASLTWSFDHRFVAEPATREQD